MPQKILVIDDNEGDRTLVKSLLEEEGYQVFEAREGRVGLIILKNQLPDLVILDVEMPGVDGYQFIIQLKELENSPDIPILILSSHEEQKEIFSRHNVTTFLTKPVDTKLLLETIKARLEE